MKNNNEKNKARNKDKNYVFQFLILNSTFKKSKNRVYFCFEKGFFDAPI